VDLQQFCQTQAPSVIYGVDLFSLENLKFILSLLLLLLHSITKEFCKIKYVQRICISELDKTLTNLQMASDEGL
jgi:hypothetical protein